MADETSAESFEPGDPSKTAFSHVPADAGQRPEPAPPGGVLSTLLQHPRRTVDRLHQPGAAGLILALAMIAVVCFALYGVLVGNFSGHEQLWAAPLKIVVGALVTALICLPSLYVFTCLSGVDDRVRLGSLLGFLTAAMALEGLMLLSFAPVVWVFSESTNSVAFISSLHLLFWAIGLYFGLRILRTGVQFLNAAQTRYLRVWVVIFVLVSLQMMTALRPLVGRSEEYLPTEKKFFLQHWADEFSSEAKSYESHGH